MQTATLQEAAKNLGIAFTDMVHFHKQGNTAIIQIDLNGSRAELSDDSKPASSQDTRTPEEEFRRKYPHIKINHPELFKLVGSMTIPPGVSGKDFIIDAIEAKYGMP